MTIKETPVKKIYDQIMKLTIIEFHELMIKIQEFGNEQTKMMERSKFT